MNEWVLVLFVGLFGAFVLAAVAVGVVAICLTISGVDACPSCKKWWARLVTGKRIVERKKCYGLVTRHGHSRCGGFVSGPRAAESQTYSRSQSASWQERAPVIKTTYEYDCSCKYCGHIWAEEKTVQVEDFDRP